MTTDIILTVHLKISHSSNIDVLDILDEMEYEFVPADDMKEVKIESEIIEYNVR